MSGVTVVRVDGRLLAVKRAGSDGLPRLKHEAAVLGRLDHPGVVALVELREIEPVELRTLFVGPDSWERRPPLDGRSLVTGLAAVAATLADLHELDTSHGSLDASHVVTAGDGRPVLCGLGDAAPADDAGRRRDLAAFADLADQLRSETDDEFGPSVGAIAAAVRESTLDARGAARRLDDVLPKASPPSSLRRPRALALGVGVVASAILGTIVIVASGVTGGRSGPESMLGSSPPPRPTAGTAAATPISTSTTSTTSTTTTIPEPSEPPRESAAVASLDHAGRRYSLGREGDTVVVGDWDCDGVDTPALLRPDAGTVAVFESWPAPGQSIEPGQVVTVAGGQALAVVAGQTCDQLRVHTAAGSRLVVGSESS